MDGLRECVDSKIDENAKNGGLSAEKPNEENSPRNALGIKWAPLNTPFERRKQTAAVAFILFLATCSSLITGFILYYLLCYTENGWIRGKY